MHGQVTLENICVNHVQKCLPDERVQRISRLNWKITWKRLILTWKRDHCWYVRSFVFLSFSWQRHCSCLFVSKASPREECFSDSLVHVHNIALSTVVGSFFPEISVRSPRRLSIFVIFIKYCMDQRIHKIFYLFLKKEALIVNLGVWACVSQSKERWRGSRARCRQNA